MELTVFLAMFCLRLGSGSDLRSSVAPDPASVRTAVLWGAGLYATGPRCAARARSAGRVVGPCDCTSLNLGDPDQ